MTVNARTNDPVAYLKKEIGGDGITVRGSIVGTRLDLQESLDFAAQGKVRATVSTDRLEDINEVFARLRKGAIEGRVVLDMGA